MVAIIFKSLPMIVHTYSMSLLPTKKGRSNEVNANILYDKSSDSSRNGFDCGICHGCDENGEILCLEWESNPHLGHSMPVC